MLHLEVAPTLSPTSSPGSPCAPGGLSPGIQCPKFFFAPKKRGKCSSLTCCRNRETKANQRFAPGSDAWLKIFFGSIQLSHGFVVGDVGFFEPKEHATHLHLLLGGTVYITGCGTEGGKAIRRFWTFWSPRHFSGHKELTPRFRSTSY